MHRPEKSSYATLKEYMDRYENRWYLQTRYEHAFMVVWNAIINLIYCVPMWIEGGNMITFTGKLVENGFPLNNFEEDSLAHVRSLMIVSPILVAIIVPGIQLGTLFLYYRYGHPWSRIFKEFKSSHNQSKSKDVHKGQNIIST